MENSYESSREKGDLQHCSLWLFYLRFVKITKIVIMSRFIFVDKHYIDNFGINMASNENVVN